MYTCILTFWVILSTLVASKGFANMAEFADSAYQRGAPLVAMMSLKDTMVLTPGPCHGSLNQLAAANQDITTSSQKLQAAAWLHIQDEPVILTSPRASPVAIEIRAIDVTGQTVYNSLTPADTVTDMIVFSPKMTKASWIFLQMESDEVTNEGNWRQWLQQVILLPESQFKRFGTIPFRRMQLTRDVDIPFLAFYQDGLEFFAALNRALYDNPRLNEDWRDFATIGIKASPAPSLVGLEPEVREILRTTPARNPSIRTSWQRMKGCW